MYWFDFEYKRLIHFRYFNLWFCLLQNVCSLFGSRSLLWDVIFFLVSKSRNVEHISIISLIIWPILKKKSARCSIYFRLMTRKVWKQGGIKKLRWQDIAYYWPPTQPLLTFVKEFLYWNKRKIYTLLTFPVPPTNTYLIFST